MVPLLFVGLPCNVCMNSQSVCSLSSPTQVLAFFCQRRAAGYNDPILCALAAPLVCSLKLPRSIASACAYALAAAFAPSLALPQRVRMRVEHQLADKFRLLVRERERLVRAGVCLRSDTLTFAGLHRKAQGLQLFVFLLIPTSS